jgi:hypothetical protein
MVLHTAVGDKSEELDILESLLNTSMMEVELVDEPDDGDAFAVVDGEALFIALPLFQTNLEPFLIHV